MEIKLDPVLGPCLIEVAARLVGNNLVEMIRDVHGEKLCPLEIAAHYYLENAAFGDYGFDWDTFNGVDSVNIDGISEEKTTIYSLTGIEEVESIPEFRRWVIKPKLGARLGATEDLLSQPYSLHLLSRRGKEHLKERSDWVEQTIGWNSGGSWITLTFNMMRLALLKIKAKLEYLILR